MQTLVASLLAGPMATLNIFASFEFDKDDKLRGDFFGQAERLTPHRVRNCSLREAYPSREWKSKAKKAIRKCDVVVVLVGQDTQNAPGVRTEVDIALSLGKPIIQIRPRKWTYGGVPVLEAPMCWRWKRINEALDEVRNRGTRVKLSSFL